MTASVLFVFVPLREGVTGWDLLTGAVACVLIAFPLGVGVATWLTGGRASEPGVAVAGRRVGGVGWRRRRHRRAEG